MWTQRVEGSALRESDLETGVKDGVLGVLRVPEVMTRGGKARGVR